METTVFDQIIELMDSKLIEIMVSTIVGLLAAELLSFAKSVIKVKFIKKLMNIKAVRVLWFTLAYILPLGIILFLITYSSLEPTFRNMALFIIICLLLIFNVLMHYVISIYTMISELTSKSEINGKTHKQAINVVFKHLNLKERVE